MHGLPVAAAGPGPLPVSRTGSPRPPRATGISQHFEHRARRGVVNDEVGGHAGTQCGQQWPGLRHAGDDAEPTRHPLEFGRGEDLDGIRVKNHSAPSAAFSNGRLELTVGDYDGNLRQYACVMKSVVVPPN